MLFAGLQAGGPHMSGPPGRGCQHRQAECHRAEAVVGGTGVGLEAEQR